jgi:nitroimidazol reductase NimA-like FMN-containing flavoprotein (pyridoxamine 5'-phosphate oxidase superfamily)
MPQQGSRELLNDPVASALLSSVNPARLAYTWTDGSPRVVPIWFHWTGEQFVLGSPPKAPKLKALAADPRVALTIDDTDVGAVARRGPMEPGTGPPAQRLGC